MPKDVSRFLRGQTNRGAMVTRRACAAVVAVAGRVPVVIAIALFFAVTPRAQQTDRARALDEQIGRIFQAREYEVPRFGPARWLPDGVSYSTVEPSTAPPGSWDIVRYDAGSGARSVLVAGSRMMPPGKAALEIDDYAWSGDAKRLLVFTNTRKVWRQNTRGDYWVLDLSSGALKRLGGDAPEASLMFAKFSPDGTRAAYVRANN